MLSTSSIRALDINHSYLNSHFDNSKISVIAKPDAALSLHIVVFCLLVYFTNFMLIAEHDVSGKRTEVN